MVRRGLSNSRLWGIYGLLLSSILTAAYPISSTAAGIKNCDDLLKYDRHVREGKENGEEIFTTDRDWDSYVVAAPELPTEVKRALKLIQPGDIGLLETGAAQAEALASLSRSLTPTQRAAFPLRAVSMGTPISLAAIYRKFRQSGPTDLFQYTRGKVGKVHLPKAWIVLDVIAAGTYSEDLPTVLNDLGEATFPGGTTILVIALESVRFQKADGSRIDPLELVRTFRGWDVITAEENLETSQPYLHLALRRNNDPIDLPPMQLVHFSYAVTPRRILEVGEPAASTLASSFSLGYGDWPYLLQLPGFLSTPQQAILDMQNATPEFKLAFADLWASPPGDLGRSVSRAVERERQELLKGLSMRPGFLTAVEHLLIDDNSQVARLALLQVRGLIRDAASKRHFDDFFFRQSQNPALRFNLRVAFFLEYLSSRNRQPAPQAGLEPTDLAAMQRLVVDAIREQPGHDSLRSLAFAFEQLVFSRPKSWNSPGVFELWKTLLGLNLKIRNLITAFPLSLARVGELKLPIQQRKEIRVLLENAARARPTNSEEQKFSLEAASTVKYLEGYGFFNE